MTSDAGIPQFLLFVVCGLFFSLIPAAIIKFLERKLTFRQAYLIALVTNLVLGTLLALYTLANRPLGFSPALDLSANLAAIALMGFTITRLAANYGIKKEGRFGLGAKVVFALFLISLIFVVAMAVFNLLRGT